MQAFSGVVTKLSNLVLNSLLMICKLLMFNYAGTMNYNNCMYNIYCQYDKVAWCSPRPEVKMIIFKNSMP